jgi:uncharacterized protein GlcG (DUF336 family)
MITLSDARYVIAAAEQKAREIGQPMNIAVVDAGGNLVSHARMDGASVSCIDISINKAARSFDIPTVELTEAGQLGQPFFGTRGSNNRLVTIFAIGVSGGSSSQDAAVAAAGIAALEH